MCCLHKPVLLYASIAAQAALSSYVCFFFVMLLGEKVGGLYLCALPDSVAHYHLHDV